MADPGRYDVDINHNLIPQYGAAKDSTQLSTIDRNRDNKLTQVITELNRNLADKFSKDKTADLVSALSKLGYSKQQTEQFSKSFERTLTDAVSTAIVRSQKTSFGSTNKGNTTGGFQNPETLMRMLFAQLNSTLDNFFVRMEKAGVNLPPEVRAALRESTNKNAYEYGGKQLYKALSDINSTIKASNSLINRGMQAYSIAKKLVESGGKLEFSEFKAFIDAVIKGQRDISAALAALAKSKESLNELKGTPKVALDRMSKQIDALSRSAKDRARRVTKRISEDPASVIRDMLQLFTVAIKKNIPELANSKDVINLEKNAKGMYEYKQVQASMDNLANQLKAVAIRNPNQIQPINKIVEQFSQVSQSLPVNIKFDKIEGPVFQQAQKEMQDILSKVRNISGELTKTVEAMGLKSVPIKLEPEISDSDIKKFKTKLEKEVKDVFIEPKIKSGPRKSVPPAVTQEFMHSQKTNRLQKQLQAKTRGEAVPAKHSQDDLRQVNDSLNGMVMEIVTAIKKVSTTEKASPALKTIADELSTAIERNRENPVDLLKVIKNVLEAKDKNAQDLLNNAMAGTDVKLRNRLQEINTVMRAYSPKNLSTAMRQSSADPFMGREVRISKTKPFGPSTTTDVYKYPSTSVKPARPQQTQLPGSEGEDALPNADAARRMVEANAKDLANSLLDLQHHIVTTLDEGFKQSKSGWKIVRKSPEQNLSEYFKLVQGYNKKTSGKQYSVKIADIEGLRMQLGSEATMQKKYGLSGTQAYDPSSLIKSFKQKVYNKKMRSVKDNELPALIADWVHKFSEEAISEWGTLAKEDRKTLAGLKSEFGKTKGTAPSKRLVSELGVLDPDYLRKIYKGTINEIESDKMLTEPIGNRIAPLVRDISVPAARMSETGAHIFETQQGSQRIIPKFAKYKTGFESLYEKLVETNTFDVTKGYQDDIRDLGIRPRASSFTDANDLATKMLFDLSAAPKNQKQVREGMISQFRSASVLRTDELISQKHLKETDRTGQLAKVDQLIGSQKVSDFVSGKGELQDVLDAFKQLGVSAYDVAKSMEQVEFNNIYQMFDQLLQGGTQYNKALQDLAKNPHLDSTVREYETYMRKLVGTIPIADPTRPRRFAHQEKVINLQSMTSPIFSDGVSEMQSNDQKQYIRDLNLNLREYVKSTDVLVKAGDKSRKLPEDVRTISSLGVPEAQAATLSDYRPGVRGDDAYLAAFDATNLKMYTDVLPELSPFGAQFQQLGRNIASTTNALAFRPAGGIGTDFPALRSAREEELIAGGRHGDQGYGFNVVAELRNTASTFEDQIVISGKLADVLTSVTKTLIQPDKMGALKFLSSTGVSDPASGSVTDIKAGELLVDIEKVNRVFQEVLGVKQEYRGRADKALIADVEKAITVVRGKSLNVQIAKIAETFFNYYGRKFTTRYGSKGVAISPTGGMEMTGKEVAEMFKAPVKVLSEKEREKAGLGSAILPKSMGELSREIFLKNRKALEKAGIDRTELAELNQNMVRSGNKFILSMFTNAELGVSPSYETKLQQELYEKVRNAFSALNIDLDKDFSGIEAIKGAYKSNVPKGAFYEETPIDIRISSFGAAKRGLQTENLETIMNNVIDAGKSGATVLNTEFESSVYKRMLGTEGGTDDPLNLSSLSKALGFEGAKGSVTEIRDELFELLKSRGVKGTDEELMQQATQLAELEKRSNYYSKTIDEFGTARQSLVGPKFVEIVEDPHANPAWSETDIEKQIKGERLNLPAYGAYATIFGQDSEFMKEMSSSIPLDTKKHYEYIKALQMINDSASEMSAGLLKSAQRLDVTQLKSFIHSTGTLDPESAGDPDSLLDTILDVRKFPGAVNLQIPDTQNPEERESFYVPGGLARTIYPEPTMAGQYGMDNISRRLQHVVNTAKNLDEALSGEVDADSTHLTIGRIKKRLEGYREQAETITLKDPNNIRAGFKDSLSKQDKQELEAILGKMYAALETTQIDSSYLNSRISDPKLNRKEYIQAFKKQQLASNPKEASAYQTTVGAAVDLLIGHRPGEREKVMARPDTDQYKDYLLKRYDAPNVLSNAQDLGAEAVKQLAGKLKVTPAEKKEDEIKYRIKKLEQAKIEYYNALAETALGKTGSVQELIFSRKVPAVMGKAINAVVDKAADLERFQAELEKISNISGVGVDLGGLDAAAESIGKIKTAHASKIEGYKKKGLPVLKQHELGIPENYAEKLPVTFSKRFKFDEDGELTKFDKPKLVKSNLSEMMKYRDNLMEAMQSDISKSLKQEVRGHVDTDLTPFIESVRYPFTGTSSVQPYEAKILRPGEGRQFEKHTLMAPGIPDMDTDAFDAVKKQTEKKLDELYTALEKEQSEDIPDADKIEKLIKTIEMLDKAISDVIPKYIAQQQKLDFDGDQIELHSAKTAASRKEIEAHYKSLTTYDPNQDATARAFRDQFTYDAIQPSTGKYTLAEQQLAFQKKFKKEEGFGFLEKPFLTEDLDYLSSSEKLGILSSVPGGGGVPKGPFQALNEIIPAVFRNPDTIKDVTNTLSSVEAPLNAAGEVDRDAYIDALLQALRDLNVNIAKVVESGVTSELYNTKYLNTISAQLFKINTGPDTEALNRLLKVFERNIGYGSGTIGAGQASFDFSPQLASRFPTDLKALGPEMGKELHTMINELVRIGIQKGLDVKHAGEIPIATEITDLIAQGRPGVDMLIEKIAEGQGAYGDIAEFADINKKRLGQNLSKLSTKDLSFDARTIAQGRGENITEAAWAKMDRSDLKKYIVDSIGFEGFLYELSDQVFSAAREGIKKDVMSWSPETRQKKLGGMDVDSYVKKEMNRQLNEDGKLNVLMSAERPLMPLYKHRTSSITPSKERKINKLRHNEMQVPELKGIFEGEDDKALKDAMFNKLKQAKAVSQNIYDDFVDFSGSTEAQRGSYAMMAQSTIDNLRADQKFIDGLNAQLEVEGNLISTDVVGRAEGALPVNELTRQVLDASNRKERSKLIEKFSRQAGAPNLTQMDRSMLETQFTPKAAEYVYAKAESAPVRKDYKSKEAFTTATDKYNKELEDKIDDLVSKSIAVSQIDTIYKVAKTKATEGEFLQKFAPTKAPTYAERRAKLSEAAAARLMETSTGAGFGPEPGMASGQQPPTGGGPAATALGPGSGDVVNVYVTGVAKGVGLFLGDTREMAKTTRRDFRGYSGLRTPREKLSPEMQAKVFEAEKIVDKITGNLNKLEGSDFGIKYRASALKGVSGAAGTSERQIEKIAREMMGVKSETHRLKSSSLLGTAIHSKLEDKYAKDPKAFFANQKVKIETPTKYDTDPRVGEISGTMDVVYKDVQGQTQKIVDVKTTSEKNFNELRRAIEEFREKTGKETPSLEEIKSYIKSAPYLKNQKMDEVASQLNLYLKAENETAEAEAHFYSALNTDYDNPLVLKQSFDPVRLERDIKAVQAARQKVQDLQASGKGLPFAKTASYEEALNIKPEKITNDELDTLFNTSTEYYKKVQSDQGLAASRTSLDDADLNNIAKNTRNQRARLDAFDDMIKAMPSPEGAGVVGIDRALREMHELSKDYLRDQEKIDVDGEGVKQFVQSIQDLLKSIAKEGPKGYTFSEELTKLKDQGAITQPGVNKAWKAYRIAVGDYFINQIEKSEAAVRDDSVEKGSSEQLRRFKQYQDYVKRFRQMAMDNLGKKTDIYTTDDHRYIAPDAARRAGVLLSSGELVKKAAGPLDEDDDLKSLFKRMVSFGEEEVPLPRDAIRDALTTLLGMDKALIGLYTDLERVIQLGPKLDGVFEFSKAKSGISRLKDQLAALLSYNTKDVYSSEQRKYLENVLADLRAIEKVYSRLDFSQMMTSQAGTDGRMPDILPVNKNLAVNEQRAVSNFNLRRLHDYYGTTAAEGGPGKGDTYRYSAKTYGPGGRVASEKIHTFIKYGEVIDIAGRKSSVFKSQVKDLTKTMAEGNRTFKIAVERVIKWGAAATLVYGGFKYLREAVDHISDVEVAMARLQMVMNPIETDFNKLKMSAIDFAKQYGVGVESVLAGMRVFAQQGLGQEEVLKRTQTSVVASNITDLSSTDATEALTAAMKVFRSEGENSMRFLDAWSNVESKAAITAGDLANAIKKSASAAANAGITFDQLNGMVAAIGSVTRQTGKEVGTSLRFIFRRLSSEKGPNVLKSIGVDVNTTKGTLKPGFQILDELSGKWDDLTRAQKLSVAQAIGGTRQYNSVLVLLDNWAEALTNVENSVNSKGTAERKNLVLMQTFAKQMEQLKATASELKLEFGKLVLPSFKAGVTGLKFIVESLNNIPSSIKLTAAAFALLATWVVKGANWMQQFTTMMDKSKIAFSEFRDDFGKQVAGGLYEVFGKGDKATNPDLFGLKSLTKDSINNTHDLTTSLGKLAAMALMAGRSYNAFLGVSTQSLAGAGDYVGDITKKMGKSLGKAGEVSDIIGDFIPGPIDDAIAKTIKWTGLGLTAAGGGTQIASQFLDDKATGWLDSFATGNAGVVKSLIPLTASLGGLALLLPRLQDGYVKLAGTASAYRDQQNAKLDVQQKEIDKVSSLISGYDKLEALQKRITKLQEPETQKESLAIGEYKSPLLTDIKYANNLKKVLDSLTKFDPGFLAGVDKYGDPITKFTSPMKDAKNDLREYLKELQRLQKVDLVKGNIEVIGKYVDELTTTDGIQEWKYQLKELADSVPVIGEMLAKGINVGPAKALEVLNEDVNRIISAKNQNPLATTFDKPLEDRLKQQREVKAIFNDTYGELTNIVDKLDTSGLRDTTISNLFNNEALRKTYDLMAEIEQKYKNMREQGETVTGKELLAAELLGAQIPELANLIEPSAKYTTERLSEANIKPLNYNTEDVKLQTGQLAILNEDIAKQYGVSTGQAKVEIGKHNQIFFKYVDTELERYRTTRAINPAEVKDFVQLIFPTNSISQELMTKVTELNQFVTGAAAGIIGFSDETLQKRQVDLGERFFGDISTNTLLQTGKGYDPLQKTFGQQAYKATYAADFEEKLFKPFEEYTTLQQQFRAATSQPGEVKEGVFAERMKELQKVLSNNSAVFQIRQAFEELIVTLSNTDRALQKSISAEKLRQQTHIETAGIMAGTIKDLAGRDLGVQNYSELTPDQTSILTNTAYVDNAKRLLELDIASNSMSSSLEALSATLSDIDQIGRPQTAWNSIFTDAELAERNTLKSIVGDDSGSTVVALKLNKANDYLASIKETSKAAADALMDQRTRKSRDKVEASVEKLAAIDTTDKKNSTQFKNQARTTLFALDELETKRNKALKKQDFTLANKLDVTINESYATMLKKIGAENLISGKGNASRLNRKERDVILERGLVGTNISMEALTKGILDIREEIIRDSKKTLPSPIDTIPYGNKGLIGDMEAAYQQQLKIKEKTDGDYLRLRDVGSSKATKKIEQARAEAEAARGIDVNAIGQASFMAAIVATFKRADYGQRYDREAVNLARKTAEKEKLPKNATERHAELDKSIKASVNYMKTMEKRQHQAAMAQGLTAITAGTIKAADLAGASEAGKAKFAIGGLGIYSLVKMLGTSAGDGLREATADFEKNFDQKTLKKMVKSGDVSGLKDAGKAIYRFVKAVEKNSKELEKVSGSSSKEIKKQINKNKEELLGYKSQVELQKAIKDIDEQIGATNFSKSKGFLTLSTAMLGGGLFNYLEGDKLKSDLKKAEKYAKMESKYFKRFLKENPKLAGAYVDTRLALRDAGVDDKSNEVVVETVKMSLKAEKEGKIEAGKAIEIAFKQIHKELQKQAKELEFDQSVFNSFSEFTNAVSNLRLELEKGLDSIDTQRFLNPVKSIGNILKGFSGDLDLPTFKSEMSPSQLLYANSGEATRDSMTAYVKLGEVLNSQVSIVDMYKGKIRDLEDNIRRATENQSKSKEELAKWGTALTKNKELLKGAENAANKTNESLRALGEMLKNLQRLNTIFEELNTAAKDVSVENFAQSVAGLGSHFTALDQMLGGSDIDALKIVLPEQRRRAAEAGVPLGTTATAQEIEYAELMSRYTDPKTSSEELSEIDLQLQELGPKYDTLRYEQKQTKENELFKASLRPYEEMFTKLELYSRNADLTAGTEEFDDIQILKATLKEALDEAKKPITKEEAIRRLDEQKGTMSDAAYKAKRNQLEQGPEKVYTNIGTQLREIFERIQGGFETKIDSTLKDLGINKESFMESAVTTPIVSQLTSVNTTLTDIKALLEKSSPKSIEDIMKSMSKFFGQDKTVTDTPDMDSMYEPGPYGSPMYTEIMSKRTADQRSAIQHQLKSDPVGVNRERYYRVKQANVDEYMRRKLASALEAKGKTREEYTEDKKLISDDGLFGIGAFLEKWSKNALAKEAGGRIFGEGGPREDKVPAYLSPGEFVIRAHSAQKLGYTNLDHMNKKGTVPGFADGTPTDEKKVQKEKTFFEKLKERIRRKEKEKEVEDDGFSLKEGMKAISGKGGKRNDALREIMEYNDGGEVQKRKSIFDRVMEKIKEITGFDRESAFSLESAKKSLIDSKKHKALKEIMDSESSFADGMDIEKMKKFYNTPSREISTVTALPVPTIDEIVNSQKNVLKSSAMKIYKAADYHPLLGAVKSLYEGTSEFKNPKTAIDTVKAGGEFAGVPGYLLSAIPGIPKPLKKLGRTLLTTDNTFDFAEHLDELLSKDKPANRIEKYGFKFADGTSKEDLSLLDKMMGKQFKRNVENWTQKGTAPGGMGVLNVPKTFKKSNQKSKLAEFGDWFMNRVIGKDMTGEALQKGIDRTWKPKGYNSGGSVRSFVGDSTGVMEVSESYYDTHSNTPFLTTSVKDTMKSFGIQDPANNDPNSPVADATSIQSTGSSFKRYIDDAKATGKTMMFTAVRDELRGYANTDHFNAGRRSYKELASNVGMGNSINTLDAFKTQAEEAKAAKLKEAFKNSKYNSPFLSEDESLHNQAWFEVTQLMKNSGSTYYNPLIPKGAIPENDAARTETMVGIKYGVDHIKAWMDAAKFEEGVQKENINKLKLLGLDRNYFNKEDEDSFNKWGEDSATGTHWRIAKSKKEMRLAQMEKEEADTVKFYDRLRKSTYESTTSPTDYKSPILFDYLSAFDTNRIAFRQNRPKDPIFKPGGPTSVSKASMVDFSKKLPTDVDPRLFRLHAQAKTINDRKQQILGMGRTNRDSSEYGSLHASSIKALKALELMQANTDPFTSPEMYSTKMIDREPIEPRQVGPNKQVPYSKQKEVAAFDYLNDVMQSARRAASAMAPKYSNKVYHNGGVVNKTGSIFAQKGELVIPKKFGNGGLEGEMLLGQKSDKSPTADKALRGAFTVNVDGSDLISKLEALTLKVSKEPLPVNTNELKEITLKVEDKELKLGETELTLKDEDKKVTLDITDAETKLGNAISTALDGIPDSISFDTDGASSSLSEAVTAAISQAPKLQVDDVNVSLDTTEVTLNIGDADTRLANAISSAIERTAVNVQAAAPQDGGAAAIDIIDKYKAEIVTATVKFDKDIQVLEDRVEQIENRPDTNVQGLSQGIQANSDAISSLDDKVTSHISRAEQALVSVNRLAQQTRNFV